MRCGGCPLRFRPWSGVAEAVCDDAVMNEEPAHFTQLEPDRYLPSRYAQSLWGNDQLNGPALVGLAGHVLETAFGLPDFMPARLTVDLVKAARGVPTTTSVRLIRDGRRLRNSECIIEQDGVTVVRAILVQYRQSVPPRGEEWAPTRYFIPPDDVDESPAPYLGSDASGWSRPVKDHKNASRTRYIEFPTTVVAGQSNSPFVRAAMVAEETSLVTNLGTEGIGYINGDLTVALARLPDDGWLGVEADAHWVAGGIAVGAATLFDRAGPFGSGLITAISNPAAQIDFDFEQSPIHPESRFFSG
jgi:hypothetical protein